MIAVKCTPYAVKWSERDVETWIYHINDCFANTFLSLLYIYIFLLDSVSVLSLFFYPLVNFFEEVSRLISSFRWMMNFHQMQRKLKTPQHHHQIEVDKCHLIYTAHFHQNILFFLLLFFHVFIIFFFFFLNWSKMCARNINEARTLSSSFWMFSFLGFFKSTQKWIGRYSSKYRRTTS